MEQMLEIMREQMDNATLARSLLGISEEKRE